jgi:uncharacterized protein YabE (DUF348 family)/3D (Asp-Asp-Asp) domain-containing protein
MRRKDDDIVVHRNAPLQGILYTKHTRKKLPKAPVSPAHAAHREPVLPVILRAVVAPFAGLASLFKKKRLISDRPLPVLKPEPKPVFINEPLPIENNSTPPAQPGLSRVLSKSSEKEKSALKNWPLAVTCAACALVSAGAIMFIPPAFAVEKKDVTINDGGLKVSAVTMDQTVGSLLDEFGIEMGDQDSINVDKSAAVSDDMEIMIHRAMPVKVSTMDGSKEVQMVAGTVQEALQKAGVAVDKNDEVYPSLDTYVEPDMEIQVVKVETKYETEKEKIGFKELSRKNKNLKKGREVTVQKGKQGIREIKYLLTYKNGVMTDREEVKSTVTQKAVDEIVEIGTRTAILMERTPRTSQIYSKTLYDHKKALKPAPEIIEKVVYADYVTAYTHTGHRTATGTYPRIGTVAVDPKKIPYGTKLYIPGYGYGRAEDTGAFRGKSFLQLDLFMDSTNDCLNWGRKRELKIYILK